MKSSFRDYFFQAILIVFSVLLALFLNEYWSGIKSDRELEGVVQNVLKEVRLNNRKLRETILYHEELLGRIDSVLADEIYIAGMTGEGGLQLHLIADKGLMQNLFGDAAWRAALLNGNLSRLKNEKLQAMAKTYDQQELTFLPVNDVMSIVSSREYLMADRGKENLLLIKGQLNELFGREKRLAIFYKELLELFKEEN
ncbi:MAG: hypothetical protein AAFQ94_04370 [Bacteroidota bacterium]